jgi:hypothetical protein
MEYSNSPQHLGVVVGQIELVGDKKVSYLYCVGIPSGSISSSKVVEGLMVGCVNTAEL